MSELSFSIRLAFSSLLLCALLAVSEVNQDPSSMPHPVALILKPDQRAPHEDPHVGVMIQASYLFRKQRSAPSLLGRYVVGTSCQIVTGLEVRVPQRPVGQRSLAAGMTSRLIKKGFLIN